MTQHSAQRSLQSRSLQSHSPQSASLAVGYYAPLPPSPSGVADYAQAMLDQLRRVAAIRLGTPGDVNLYHVGNNRLHADIYRKAVEVPGVVILHDALLQHLFLGIFDEATYIEEFVYNYGEWNRGQACELWRRRSSAMGDPRFFRYPMLRRLAESSLAVIVHSAEARRTVLAHAPQARVAEIPHLSLEAMSAPSGEKVPGSNSEQSSREEFRRHQLGLQSGDLLCGVYGYLRESKRLHVILRVVQRLRQEGHPLKLLVAGSFASDDYGKAIRPLLARADGVIVRGASDPGTFRQLLQAADLCINLRYPSAGESSGIAVRAMALGVPLIMTAGVGGLPTGAYVPVNGGMGEEAALTHALVWLLNHTTSRQAVARTAFNYCRDHMDPAIVCRAVWRILTSARHTVAH